MLLLIAVDDVDIYSTLTTTTARCMLVVAVVVCAAIVAVFMHISFATHPFLFAIVVCW